MMGARVDNSLGPSGRSLKQIIHHASVEIKKRKAGDFSSAVTPAENTDEQRLTSTNTGMQKLSDVVVRFCLVPVLTFLPPTLRRNVLQA